MLKIKWIKRITNEAVLTRIKKKRELWSNIKIKKDKIIRHLLRHDSLTKCYRGHRRLYWKRNTKDRIHETNHNEHEKRQLKII